MRKLNKAIIFALLSVFAVQYIAPTVAQSFDVWTNNNEMRRIIRELNAVASSLGEPALRT